MAKVSRDFSQWPLVQSKVVGVVDDASLEEYLDIIRTALARQERYFHVTDLTEMVHMGKAQRKRFAAFNKQIRPQATKLVIGIAIVSKSPLVRGAVTAINWLFPFSSKHHTFKTKEDALLYAREQLAHERDKR